MRSREEDEDSDVASLRKPGHSHKKARLAALPAKQKAWNRDLAYEAWQASERCSETSCNRPHGRSNGDSYHRLRQPCGLHADEGWTPETSRSRKAHLAAMREVLMSVDVTRILEDLGNLRKFKLPARIERKGDVAQEGWGMDCSEV